MQQEEKNVSSAEAGEYAKMFPAMPTTKAKSHQNSGSIQGNGHMRVGPREISKTLVVPSSDRKLDQSDKFGEGERKPNDIAKDTKTKIEMSISKDHSLTFVISGTPASVNDAIRKILKQYKTQKTKSISVPKESYPMIMGKNGQRLKDLEKETETRITIPGHNDKSDQILVVGAAENIELACAEILKISEEQAKKASVKVDIDRKNHPLLCGADNEFIEALQMKRSVKISVPPASKIKAESKEDYKVVTWVIKGHREDIQAVQKELLARQEELNKTCKTMKVQVPVEQHRYVAGHKDSGLNEILRECKVSVEMPHEGDTDGSVTLYGPRDNLTKAIEKVHNRAKSMVSAKVSCPQWIFKYISGPKSNKYMDPNLDLSQVHMSYTEDNNKSGWLKFEGPTTRISEVQVALDELVTELRNNLCYEEFPVDAKYYKHIIGKGGCNINRVQEEYSVDINISDSHIIRIEGEKQGVEGAKKDIEGMIFKIENEVEEDMIISAKLHRDLIGVRGGSIRELKDKFPSVIINIPSQTENSDVVKLRGPKDDVKKCRKALADAVKEIERKNYCKVVTIFKDFHKNIIGKGGATIKKIREDTNTKIDLPKETDKSDDIIIRGVKEDVERAAQQILAIQNEMAAFATEEVPIPKKVHTLLTGPKKRLVQAIKTECGSVTIKFPPAESKSDIVTIRGLDKEDVKRARDMLMELAAETEQASFTAELRVKPEHHNFIIGRKGMNVKRLKELTGAKILFPDRNDEDQDLITIMGTEEQVAKAKKELEVTIKNIDSIVEDSIQIDTKHHRHFTRRVIEQIQDECGNIKITFPRNEESSTILIKGPKDGVEMVKQRLQEEVQDLEERITIEFTIPHDVIRKERLPDIQRDHNVTIKVLNFLSVADDGVPHGEGQVNGDVHNESQDSCDTISIWGRPENCELAKQAVLDLIPIEKELNVPFEYHSSIIGKAGKNINQIRVECGNVRIEVPKADLRSNIIKIRGRRSTVEQAVGLIEEQVANLIAEKEKKVAKSFSMTLDIDPDYHSIIIGRNGSKINEIRQKYDTQISFPRKGEHESHITIVGFEDQCKAAAEEIQHIVDDLKNLECEELDVDERIIARLIGAKGRNLSRIQNDYKVTILSVKRDGSNKLIVYGDNPDNVEDAIEELRSKQDDYLEDVAHDVRSSSSHMNNSNPNPSRGDSSGFVVKGAPWDKDKSQKTPELDSQRDFPSMGKDTASVPSGGAWVQR
ncbi:unnamed protein product [Bemisia tabaci]|uniref:K Homology domain-containing protein n=1 Tax=Bemisia tabaci TaxID=7038 RepID=A0A9P0EW62_BEMTA|nr:unnamed protein product [Bemisia tabaci]